MTGALRLLPALLLALAAPAAQAATSRPDLAPGVEVDDACMAEALLESGFQGAVRVATPAARDHSLEACDLEAETLLVADYRAVAGPCTADALRDQGFLGRINRPRQVERNDPACLALQAPAAPPSPQDLVTFRGADGREITTMRPIPNPY
ncbi:hypothetical protein [Phenylobacterium sp.]|uniref:hypothetical protein n=1 Tax=Phenylobacterium sp. TaxID=1871053 RepID=UPI0027338F2C|nr:hypothetical protein [Phenylobacterium sp.]MDP3853903.1 hypothetical protein [Phenylobacterium sp.]